MVLALTQAEAARALSMSVNHFKRHVRPELPVVYVGGLRRYPVRAIEAWLDKQCSL